MPESTMPESTMPESTMPDADLEARVAAILRAQRETMIRQAVVYYYAWVSGHDDDAQWRPYCARKGLDPDAVQYHADACSAALCKAHFGPAP